MRHIKAQRDPENKDTIEALCESAPGRAGRAAFCFKTLRLESELQIQIKSKHIINTDKIVESGQLKTFQTPCAVNPCEM